MNTRERHAKFLTELEATIRAVEAKLTQSEPYVRPFVCDGFLVDCNVFIVGINPRENTPFRPYWDGTYYDKRDWERHYLSGRYHRVTMAGVSRTRKKVELFCRAVAPARVLETNVYPVATDSEAELERHPHCKDDSILNCLWKGLQPGVVLVHGNLAEQHLRRLLGLSTSLPQDWLWARPWDPDRITYVKFIARHLSRAGSLGAMRQLGSEVSALLGADRIQP